MKNILLSVRPKWCEKILSGEKTIEVRKSAPKEEVPFKCHIYCSYGNDKENYMLGRRGKVIGEFICDKVKEYRYGLIGESLIIQGYSIGEAELLATCMGYWDFEKYGHGKPLYGWHISDLKIYDKPRELNEFRKCGFEQDYERWDSLQFIGISSLGDMALKYPSEPKEDDYILKRPPQSWCYVEGLDK